MKILLTGADGYIGSVLGPSLVRDGHDVVALDTGYYREGLLHHQAGPIPLTVVEDVRRVSPATLAGVEAVVHLGELSNDPTGQLTPRVTYAINHEASVRLAALAREAGARLFVYTSSCSVYGVATLGFVAETSPTHPQTAYAVCKTLVERDVGALAGDAFSPVFLRNATAYGASPRMRFDIVVNNLAGLARTTGTIAMTSDGSPWRPQVHVLDICQAVRCCLTAPREAVHGQVFNVGRTDENFTVREIAEIVAGVFPGCGLTFGAPGGDNRSYRVSFDKIAHELPGFSCGWSVRRGVEQLHALFERVGLDRAAFESRAFTRLRCLEHLLCTGQIDGDFFWTAPGDP